MNDDTLILYIIMRIDLDSLNPGKAMAQANHAFGALKKMIRVHISRQADYILWQEQTSQDFGTVIVLGGNEGGFRRPWTTFIGFICRWWRAGSTIQQPRAPISPTSIGRRSGIFTPLSLASVLRSGISIVRLLDTSKPMVLSSTQPVRGLERSMNDDTLILYIIMRIDLDSLNPGKAMAQANHAFGALKKMIRVHISRQADYILWQEQTSQDFGTVIVLGGNEGGFRRPWTTFIGFICRWWRAGSTIQHTRFGTAK